MTARGPRGALALGFIGGLLAGLTAAQQPPPETPATPPAAPATRPGTPATRPGTPATRPALVPAAQRPQTRPVPPAGALPRVVLEIEGGGEPWGRIVLELDESRAPVTVRNFLRYVDEGFYDGTVFHRVLAGFLIQGGGYARLGEPKTDGLHEPIPCESDNGLRNLRGTIAAARKAAPHSATSQFFINVVDNPKLDHPGHDGTGYCVFGRVVEGLDVVDRIQALPTTMSLEARRAYVAARQAGQTPRDIERSQPVGAPPTIRRAYRATGAEATTRPAETGPPEAGPAAPAEPQPGEPPPEGEEPPVEPEQEPVPPVEPEPADE